MGKDKDKNALDTKVFMWAVIENDITIQGLLKKRAGTKGTSLQDRYVVITRNYMLYYKPATKEGIPKKFDEPKGTINLGQVDPNEVRVAHDKDPMSFQVVVPGRTYYFQCKDDKLIAKWIRIIKEKAESLRGVAMVSQAEVTQTLLNAQATFPRNMVISNRVNNEQIPRFIEDRRRLKAAFNQFDPFVKKASQFIELFFGANRVYMEWWNGNEGPGSVLQRTENDILTSWRNQIDRAAKEANEQANLRFFCEDLAETMQVCEVGIAYAEGLGNYCKEFLMDASFMEEYTKKRQTLEKAIETFKTYPSLRSIDFKTYKGGTIKGANGSEWTFSTIGGIALKGKVNNVDLHFVARGPELTSADNGNQAGVVIWNGKVWAWYHPSKANGIRFDWDGRTSTFQNKPIAPSETCEYANWMLEGTSLKCAKSGLKAPSCPVWTVTGHVPVCAALLAAMAEVILGVK